MERENAKESRNTQQLDSKLALGLRSQFMPSIAVLAAGGFISQCTVVQSGRVAVKLLAGDYLKDIKWTLGGQFS